MKSTHIILLALLFVLATPKHMKKALHRNSHKYSSVQHEVMSPVNERRMNTYGKLTTDKEVMKKLMGEGLTNNYQ